MRVFDKTFLKFIVVGVINTIFGSAIMFCLYNVFSAGYWFSSMANYVLGSILSFFLNKYFTFSVKKWNLFIIITFIINIVLCYAIAYGIAKPFISYLLRNSSVKIKENIALFTGMCLFTGINYVGQRFVVFRRTGEEE
jgi:putative flippase GtrA